MVAHAKQQRIEIDETATQRLFTVDEYEWMARVGILRPREPVELINGVIVNMSPIGNKHLACVDGFTEKFVIRLEGRAIVRVQGSIRISDLSEPEPDLVLLKPRADRYKDRSATANDIFLVVEVADSSLAYDRKTKAPMYALAGVPEMWLADALNQRMYSFSRPVGGVYQDQREIGPGESIAPLAFPDVLITYEEIFLTDVPFDPS